MNTETTAMAKPAAEIKPHGAGGSYQSSEELLTPTGLIRFKSVLCGHRTMLLGIGSALLFFVLIGLFIQLQFSTLQQANLLMVAALIGGYMALNIGANDVANNVGPAVGSKAMTLAGAILVAAIFEAGGALIAGGDVVTTIKSGIIYPEQLANTDTFVWLMLAALLAGAIWLNITTALGAPVSTTHSIVGGVLGAGIAAGGLDIANWGKMAAIASSWLISPLMGGIIAATFLFVIKRRITYQTNMSRAAARVVPVLVAVMVWAFATYLMLKGVKHVWKIGFGVAASAGLVIAFFSYWAVRPMVKKNAAGLGDTKSDVNQLFTVPLIFAAALLSFAHGANDVANAIGPLAAINEALGAGGVTSKAPIPLWIMLVGALGITLGLAFFGPKLIRTVGTEITDLDKMRAFSVAMAAAITVIIASQFGLPVSSTHTAIGAIFGVGFLREYLKANHARKIQKIKDHYSGDDPDGLETLLEEFRNSSIAGKERLLKRLKKDSATVTLNKRERKRLRKIYRQDLVKRSQLVRIAAAWVITVPASGLMAAILYFTIRGMLLE